MNDLATLLTDIGTIIGGVPGTVVRYAGAIVRKHARHNERVRARIELERRLHTAAGQAALDASRIAGHESKGSGAR